MKKMLGTVALICLTSGAQAATYNPTGVQSDVAVADVATGGWSVVYSDIMANTGSLANVYASLGQNVMLATHQVGSATYDLLASIDSALFMSLHTALNQTVLANGAQWYKNGYSLGFALAGDTISQNSADTGSTNGDFRVSLHTNYPYPGQNSAAEAETFGFGYRSGLNMGLNNSSDWEIVFLTDASVASVPVPASLPLMFAGLGAVAGFGALRKRKQAA